MIISIGGGTTIKCRICGKEEYSVVDIPYWICEDCEKREAELERDSLELRMEGENYGEEQDL